MLKRRLILTAGWLLPIVLALLFFLKGRVYDPAFFEPPVASASALPVPESLGGWTLEHGGALSADRMYEKINGRAEYYLQYGATALYSGEWVSGGQNWDMYLYEFAEAQGARGVFIGERPATCAPLDSLNGYTVPGQITALAGNFYLQLGALQAEADMVSAEKLAVELVSFLGGPGQDADEGEPKLTPASLAGERVVPDSEEFILENSFGFSSLNNVQMNRVSLNGTEAVWFRAEGGVDALKAYAAELAEYGGEELFAQDPGSGGSMFGTWEFAALIDGVLWGVRDVPSKEALLQHWTVMQAALEGK